MKWFGRIKKAGSKLGIPGQTFDRILASAAADQFPDDLVNQLKPDGILVVPVRNSIIVATKTDSGIKQEIIPGFIFVPLIEEPDT